MASKLKITMNHAAVVRVVGGQTQQAAYRAAQKTRGRVMSNIHQLGRVNTGRMIAGLQARKDPSSTDLRPSYTISSSARSQSGFDYPAAQETGTRPHGPVTAKMLAWTPKGGGPMIFARWVRGVSPGRFFARALAAVSASDFQ